MRLTVTIDSEKVNDKQEWARQLQLVTEQLVNGGDMDASVATGRSISGNLMSNDIKIGKYLFNPK